MSNSIPSEPTLATLAQRMSWLVEVSGISHRALDRIVPVTAGHTRFIALGTFKEPKRSTIRRYANALGCTETWLFEGKGRAPSATAVRARCQAAHQKSEARRTAEREASRPSVSP